VVGEALAPLVRLGVQVQRRGVATVGVEVEEVLSDGPAAMAGLRRGDTITAVAGRTTTSVDQLAERLEAAGAWESIAYSDPLGGEHLTTVRLAGKGPARHGRSTRAPCGFGTKASPESGDD
jgi:putative serine protease PepD